MSSTHEVKIIAFVGMPGAGKSSAVDYVTAKGYPKVYFGGVLYDAMRDAGIEITPESQQLWRKKFRDQEGPDFVVKRIIKQIHGLIEAGQKHIIADGLYSWTEYKTLKHEFPGQMQVIAIIAPSHIRYHRLEHRTERPFTRAESEQRDWREIEDVEKGGPIAIADHYVINARNLDELHAQVDHQLDELDFYK